MLAEYFTYRSTNMVVPPLDLIAYPDGIDKIPAPPFVRSTWGIPGKTDTNKGAVAGSVAKAVGNGMLAVLSIGTGGAGNAVSHSMSNIGDAIDASASSSKYAMQLAAELIGKAEKAHWEQYHFLQTFVPAEGNLGEMYKGREDNEGYVGYCFYDNGDYFEGYFYNNAPARTGVFIFANGDRMWGTLVNGIKDGECAIITADGTRIYGTFENDQITHGLMETENNAFYGNWAEGMLHGSGAARYADGSCFCGEWHYGNPKA